FLDHKGDHGAIVVHGHTISDEPEVMSNRIGIDTGAFQSGILTALALEDDRRWFLTAGTKRA
ncbi:MAG TPA: serine/threonine protein phosphatase, partial [Sphingomonas sp.]